MPSTKPSFDDPFAELTTDDLCRRGREDNPLPDPAYRLYCIISPLHPFVRRRRDSQWMPTASDSILQPEAFYPLSKPIPYDDLWPLYRILIEKEERGMSLYILRMAGPTSRWQDVTSHPIPCNIFELAAGMIRDLTDGAVWWPKARRQ